MFFDFDAKFILEVAATDFAEFELEDEFSNDSFFGGGGEGAAEW